MSDWPVPLHIAISVLEAVQGSVDATDEGMEEIDAYINRVARALNPELGDRLKSAAEAIHSSRDSVENIPARYAFFLSHEMLPDAGRARRLLRIDYRQALHMPTDLAENLGILVPAGALISAGSVAEAATAGVLASPVGMGLAAAGLIVSGAAIFDALKNALRVEPDPNQPLVVPFEDMQ